MTPPQKNTWSEVTRKRGARSACRGRTNPGGVVPHSVRCYGQSRYRVLPGGRARFGRH